jgi:hypothetical protein
MLGAGLSVPQDLDSLSTAGRVWREPLEGEIRKSHTAGTPIPGGGSQLHPKHVVTSTQLQPVGSAAVGHRVHLQRNRVSSPLDSRRFCRRSLFPW